MAFEWVAGLFQADNQQTRGLSGDSAHSVALDDSNPYYNYRLRRHKAEGDLVADPGLLWYTSPYVKRRSGLGTHVGAEIGDGTANYTDVLLILGREDFARATGEWQQGAVRALQQEFENFCRRENFSRLHAHRPLGIRILEDGSPALGGHSLDLARGEFITGLLPNLYTGPVRGSYPVIGVHVNLPGVWEGYQEVGRLYNDQILFTLGSHWLDNFCHPSLQQAALYRLRQYPDGSFVHIVNPDLQDQYQVTSTNQGGASVLTLATRLGQPLAYLVLAVIDPPSTRPSRPAMGGAGRPDIHMPQPPARQTSVAAGVFERTEAEAVPSIAPPMMMDDEEPVSNGVGAPTGHTLGGKTIIPDAPSERIFTLQERGALLQKVHFSAFMLGYDVYLGPRGELGTHVEDPAATFQVRKRSVSLVAHVDGVMVGGRPVPAGVEVPVDGDVKIEVAGQRLEYRDLRGLSVDGWPYVGEIRRPASSTYMIWGEDYHVGRSRECRVVLPDEPRNDNIHWKPSVGDGATIRARTGEIPKSRFYTDSIMVASEHATVDLRNEAPHVVCNARHCYIYVRRNGEVQPLYPATSPQEPKEMDLEPGDEVLVGNCLFHVGYTPSEEGVAPGPAPRVELSSDSLAGVVHRPDLSSLEHDIAEPPPTTHAPPLPTGNRPAAEDVPDYLKPEPVVPPPVERPFDAVPHPLGTDRPVPMDDADDPTVPGMVMPRDPSGWDDGGTAQYVEGTPSGAAARDHNDVSVDGEYSSTSDVGGWDGDDWSEDRTAPRTARPDVTDVPPSPPAQGAAGVPTPFPDVEPGGLPLVGTDYQFERTDEVRAARRALPRNVVSIDDAEAQFELGRPLHLVLAGWTVNGEVLCGNHQAADLVIPENRIVATQTFNAVDYFRLRIRGRRGHLSVLAPREVLINEEAPAEADYTDPDEHVIEVIRRDEAGEEDFSVRLRIEQDPALPDPRARFVAFDHSDPLSKALVTRGLPRAQSRTLDLEGIRVSLFYDREVVTVSDYLDTYRRGSTFRSFFVQRQGERFKTAPEDGASFELRPGDRLIVGHCVYLLREE
ncbi:MAG: hypothetical protein KTR31_20460 [Myxococcales bacterium]|nr:hypothetical protein [Myxococcales bacterium]